MNQAPYCFFFKLLIAIVHITDPSFPPPPTSPPTVVEDTIVQGRSMILSLLITMYLVKDGIDSPPIRETPPNDDPPPVDGTDPPVDGTDPPVDGIDPPIDGTAGGNTSNTCKSESFDSNY